MDGLYLVFFCEKIKKERKKRKLNFLEGNNKLMNYNIIVY